MFINCLNHLFIFYIDFKEMNIFPVRVPPGRLEFPVSRSAFSKIPVSNLFPFDILTKNYFSLFLLI